MPSRFTPAMRTSRLDLSSIPIINICFSGKENLEVETNDVALTAITNASVIAGN